MTYEESYRKCATEDDALAQAWHDANVVWFFFGGNPDRLQAIEDAFNKVAEERGWLNE